MKCKNCGKELVDGSRFCYSCGADQIKYAKQDNFGKTTSDAPNRIVFSQDFGVHKGKDVSVFYSGMENSASKGDTNSQICLVCGAENEANAVFCGKCGTKLSEKHRIEPQKQTNEGDGLLCPFCGAKNSNDALFCEECGRSIKHGKKKPSGKLIGIIALAGIFISLCFFAVFIGKNHISKKYDDNNVGEIYFKPTEEEHIAISEDGTTVYADNEVLVVAKSGVSKKKIEKLANEYEAQIVGYIEQTGDYQWELNNTESEEKLNDIIESVKANDLVEDAYLNYIGYMSEYSEELEDIKPGIYWSDDLSWEEDISKATDVSGKSWGVEAIRAPETWIYFNKNKSGIKPIKIGLFDSGFAAQYHDDLEFADYGVFYNDPDQNGLNLNQAVEIPRDHGTVCAGIMAAIGTNTRGINGVYPYGKGRLYGVSVKGMGYYDENQSYHASAMMQKIAFAELIVRNVRVINQSMGFNWQQFFEKDDNGNYKNNSQLAKNIRERYNESLDRLYEGFNNNDSYIKAKKYEAAKFADFLNRALKLGYDFVITSAAGNTGGKESEYSAYNNLISNTSAYREVYDRIIVVGSIGKSYAISDFSDSGNRVDVFAPGEWIFSTGDESSYVDEQFGTSFASPHVAGVCANIWSVNNSLTGKEVKAIVMSSLLEKKGNEIRYPYTAPDGKKKGIVDCMKAVEEAVRRRKKNNGHGFDKEYGIIEGWVYEADEYGNPDKSRPLLGALITLYNKNGQIVRTYNESGSVVDNVKTDKHGHYELFASPGTYSVAASLDGYSGSESDREDNIIVESKQVHYAKPLALKSNSKPWIIAIDPTHKPDKTESNQNRTDTNGSMDVSSDVATSLLKSYAEQKDFMYGRSYTYASIPRTEFYPEGGEEWGGISSDQLLGYSIDDYDDDGINELLIISCTNEYHLQLEMYEVVDGEVVLADKKYTESDTGYGAVPLLHAASSTVQKGETNGILCCLVQESNHRIFLQYTDTLWYMGGNEMFIVSTRYTNNEFSDYNVYHDIGTSADGDTRRLEEMGVPDPDFDGMFYEFKPLINCFNGDAREIFLAEQRLIDEQENNGIVTKVVSQTTFDDFENEKAANSSDGGQTKTPDNKTTDSNGNYQELYADYLRELSRNASVPGRLTFQLIYLDGDDIPELVTAEGHDLYSQASIYTIVGNRVMPIYCDGDNWGNHGGIAYCEHESIILNSYTTSLSGEYVFYRIYDEEVLRVRGFSKKGEDFYIEENHVDQAEYEAAYNECGGNRLKGAGYDTGTVVSEDSIQLLLNNDPVCYNGEGGPF